MSRYFPALNPPTAFHYTQSKIQIFIMDLVQRFLTRSEFHPPTLRGHLQQLETFLIVTVCVCAGVGWGAVVVVILASNEWSPGMQLNILQCTGLQPPTHPRSTKNWLKISAGLR